MKITYWKDQLYPPTKIAIIHDALAQEQGKSPEIFKAAGLNEQQARSPDTLVSLEQILAAYAAAMRLARDPQFAFRTGRRIRATYYGMYGFGLMSCPDFRGAIHFVLNHQRLAGPIVDLRFEENAIAGIWTLKFSPPIDVTADLHRFIIEYKFGVFQSIQQDLLGPMFMPIALRAAFARSDSTECAAKDLNAMIAFDQAVNQFVFDAVWFDHPMQFGNAIAHESVRRVCDELERKLQTQAGIAGRVRSILMKQVQDFPSLEMVARQVNLSERTLRRNLNQEGTNYRELCDQVRAEVAIKYLCDTRMSMEDVAYAVGFSEAANFRRAFRRWTGTSPQEARRSAHANQFPVNLLWSYPGG